MEELPCLKLKLNFFPHSTLFLLYRPVEFPDIRASTFLFYSYLQNGLPFQIIMIYRKKFLDLLFIMSWF